MATRLEQTLLALIAQANDRWRLFPPGGEVLVGVSGGKDSLGLLHLLCLLPLRITAAHVQVNGPLPPQTADFIQARAHLLELPSEILSQVAGQKNPCFACSRLRRRALLQAAEARGASTVALAHHREDVVHTLLLNMLYSRETSTMLPRQPLFSGRFFLVRPLYLAPQSLLLSLMRELQLPVAPADCPHAGHTRRARIAVLLADLQRETPAADLTDNLFAALFRRNEAFLPHERAEED